MAAAPRKMDVVYDQLKAQFRAGDLRFGERLEVNQLAQAMGTSRQPVLEALKRLQAEGLVEVTPQVGSHVVIPSPQAIEDFFHVFAVLEGLATRLATERRDDRDLIELAPTQDLVLTAAKGRKFDLGVYLAGNKRFHGTIHRIARSTEAAEAAHRYWERADFLIASMNLKQMRETLARSVEEHRAIFKAIKKGDADLAASLAESHVRAFAPPIEVRLRAVLEEMDLPVRAADLPVPVS